MNKNYPKEYFNLVQDNERLRDKPLQTKQLSYFQDAMMRFTKNKYNVMASIILLILIVLSITVPMITPKELYTETNSALTTLPPKVPLLEKLGILDGTKDFKNQPIDLDSIDPETGLGYPTDRFNIEFLDFSTLKNQIVVGSERDILFVGGQNAIYINAEKSAYTIQSSFEDHGFIEFLAGTKVSVEVLEMDGTGVLEVYVLNSTVVEPTSWDEYTLIGTIDSVGTHDFDPMLELAESDRGLVALKYILPTASVDGDEFVKLESVTVDYLVNTDDLEDIVYSGFFLSNFDLISLDSDTENGRFLRSDAEMVVSSFTYDLYGALFSDTEETIGAEEYAEILAANPGMEDTIILPIDYVGTPEDATTYAFGTGFPITSVLSVDSITIPGAGTYTNYHVMMNGAYALGFEAEPNFYFGTDVFGHDLFSLIWLGLRTSLLLGVLSSLVNIIVGVIWGAISAYYGGQVDILMERFTDIWGSFPQITMIGIITVLIGPGFTALFIFLVYDGWIRIAKVTRLQFYRYKGREYVLAARTLGASDRRIIFKHILPNALGTIVTRVVLSIPSVIFLEVTLSYLGFGIGNGQSLRIGPLNLTGTSIGVILNDGQQQIFAGNLWLIIYPTIVVSILMITFNMFGNALRDALNPQLRGSE